MHFADYLGTHKDVQSVDDIPQVEYGAHAEPADGAGHALPSAMGGDIYSRAFKIFKADLEEYGYSASCPGCTAIREGIGYRLHNKECRIRIANELMKTESGRQRIQRASERPAKRPREIPAQASSASAQAGSVIPRTPPGRPPDDSDSDRFV